MSHTINRQHASSRSALHPQQRGVSSHMPPPSRPASQQTTASQHTTSGHTPILPPHLRPPQNPPTPNTIPIYAPVNVYPTAASSNGVNVGYSNGPGLMDYNYPDGTFQPNGTPIDPIDYSNPGNHTNGGGSYPHDNGQLNNPNYPLPDGDDLPSKSDLLRGPVLTDHHHNTPGHHPDLPADVTPIAVDHDSLQLIFGLSEENLNTAKTVSLWVTNLSI
ncbi:hypothetical protein PGTUg99_014595 [Puccinia graminis f. sp. tritici]|uniref:Uncharacterized protein n=1 Tax=Puccinia graminis f. sp. tritici TaxID=56615 RepID=A0A5B0S7M3_PUCGR|nr:hypothetical protein PGTUg99_014595 [Puccinia graminis f. sp. tritici]